MKANFRYFQLCIGVLAMLPLLALAAGTQSPVGQEDAEPRVAFVQLFEWTWPDIARECETFLGPMGYTAVQVSPPQEHVTGEQWWTRYQPVSYRLESRGGTRAQFENMVQRCRAAGVGIYADAIINHMSGVGEGTGVAGSVYGRYEYPVPYDFDDFHHCGRHGDDDIRDYQDAWEVRTCELAELADLNTSDEAVQEKIAAYLSDLLDMGVAGFRIDAAKHMDPGDIKAILGRLPVQPFVFQEVIDRSNEPITGGEYTNNGPVTEFKYGMELYTAFTDRDLSGLESLGSAEGWVQPDLAVVFIDNHDVQRGHGGASHVLTHMEWNTYELANIFMLAWPYGYPMVMSSYRFSDPDGGPPSTQAVDEQGSCTAAWVCEHRDSAIAAMVGFRRQTHGQPVTGWTQLSPSAIAFSRGDSGFVALNAGTSVVNARVPVGLAPGRYRDLLGHAIGAEEEQGDLIVAEDQTVTISLPPMSAIAAHAGAVN
jgi:alpha-amylase